MIQEMISLAACGAAGALTYSFPIFIKAISKVPPTPFAAMSFGFSVFVGSVSAALFTQLVGFHWPWTVQPQPYPLAMIIGLGSNPLTPIVLNKLKQWAEMFEGKER